MKTVAAICALTLFIIGCASDRTHQDGFASFRDTVKRRLVQSSDCGPIVTNEVVVGRYFEVKPKPKGLSITVYERQFFSQKEWESRYASGTNLLFEFMERAMTNAPVRDVKEAERVLGITNLFGLSQLPEWSYQRVGIDVRVLEVDEAYTGFQEDNAEAQKRYNEIIKLLKPYRRPNPH